MRAPRLVVGAGPRFLVRANLARDRRAATCRWPAQHSSIGLKTKLRRPEVLNRAGRKEAQRRSAGVRGLARCGQLLDTARKHQRVDSGHCIPCRPVEHVVGWRFLLQSALDMNPPPRISASCTVLVPGIATATIRNFVRSIILIQFTVSFGFVSKFWFGLSLSLVQFAAPFFAARHERHEDCSTEDLTMEGSVYQQHEPALVAE